MFASAGARRGLAAALTGCSTLVAVPVAASTRRTRPQPLACHALQAPDVFVVRHGESVANVLKRQEPLEYHKRAMLDDSRLPHHKRLRDAVLSNEGVRSALQKAAELEMPRGPVLLVVSPMTRTVLTASLLFHRLLESGVEVKVVVEPAAMEVINRPWDIVENVGRDPRVVHAEAKELLQAAHAPAASLELLDRVCAALDQLSSTWWFQPIGHDDLPRRVLHEEMEFRMSRLRSCVQQHIEEQGSCNTVYIVAHWGVALGLTGDGHAQNLETRQVDWHGQWQPCSRV